MIFDKNLFPLRPGMTLNSGDVHGKTMWLQVGSRECVCACACVCVGGGGREGEGSLSATVDSDNFNGASHEQRILYENTFACH